MAFREQGANPMNLSIKNVPEDLVRRLKERAKANHRSLQGEVLSMLEASVYGRGAAAEPCWIETPTPIDPLLPRANRDPR